MQRRNNERLPEVYYQRRRVAAVAALVVVVLLLVWLLSSLGGKNNNSTGVTQTSEAAPVTSSVATTSSAAESSSESASASASESHSSEATTEPLAAGTCPVEQLVITASTDHPNYAANEFPTFYMALKNPTPEDCTVNLTDNPLRFEVYDLATNQRVWSDVDCNDAVKTGMQELKAGEEIYFQAKWSRTGSAPQQCNQRPAVPAADYFLHTVIGNNASAPATFSLK